MTILHTKFLVNWTGTDFHSPISALDDNIRQKYIDRLTDILTNGFLMRKNEEKAERIYDLDGQWVQAAIARMCFTETKLSLAKKHAQTYGNLGIGVDRQYVINRYGNPVFYVMNGNKSNIGVCTRKVLDYLKEHDKAILAEFNILLGYLKKMGEPNADDLQYYDELEWRITHLTRLEQQGLIVAQDKNNHIYRIGLSKEDVKIIVFPDTRTKILALNNQNIINQIDKPICVTMDDCENF